VQSLQDPGEPCDAIRRPRDTPIWKLEAALKCRSCRKGPLCAAGAHDQADSDAGESAPILLVISRISASLSCTD
jgi:hypothetical protein